MSFALIAVLTASFVCFDCRAATLKARKSMTLRLRPAASLLGVMIFGLGGGADRLAARVQTGCSAMVCEESAALVAALDSVLRAGEARGFLIRSGPRILRTVHRSPLRENGTLSPPVDRVTAFDLSLFRQRWPGYAIVDSSDVASGHGSLLTSGGPLVVFAPVTWLAEDLVRVRLALYYTRIDYGEEWFVRLRRTKGSWHVARVEPGSAN